MSLKILPGRLEDVIDATEGLAVVVIDMQAQAPGDEEYFEGKPEVQRIREILRYASKTRI
jgi:hypothetical protein